MIRRCFLLVRYLLAAPFAATPAACALSRGLGPYDYHTDAHAEPDREWFLPHRCRLCGKEFHLPEV